MIIIIKSEKFGMSNSPEQSKASQDVKAEPLRSQFTRGESQIAYDFKNKEFIAVSGVQENSCVFTHLKPSTHEAMIANEDRELLEMTDTNRRMQTLDLLIESNAHENDSLDDALERAKHQLKKRSEPDAEKKIPLHYFADTWNILRFVKASNSMSVSISPNGLNLTVTHGQKGQDRQREDELVLTNMSFTSGLHFWEIIASTGCNNIQVGVHNPISKTEVMASFKTKSKRVITVCLDLYEGVVKFWLNDNFIQKKVTKLFPIGGPWVPCVKIGKERNTLTLNPFANAPTHFREVTIDRGCRLDTILMPLLTNFLCVTGLPQIEATTQSETLKIFNQIFQHANNQISDIHMPAPGSKSMFCFIKFHHYSYMVEFLEKHRPAGKFKIYEAHEIFEWFAKGAPTLPELEQPFTVIKRAIALPLKGLNPTLKCIKEAHASLSTSVPHKQEAITQAKSQAPVEICLQVFSDKLIVSKAQSNQVKAVSRSHVTQEFNMEDVCFSEDHQSLNSLIQLSANKRLMAQLIETLSWTRVFKQSLPGDRESSQFSAETAYHGLFFTFFRCLGAAFDLNENVKFYAPIFASKMVLDAVMFQLKRLLRKAKKQEEDTAVCDAVGFEKQSRSDEELMQLIALVSDLQEQLWAKTRSEQCLPEVKYLCQSVSRPQSALNRLGSFVQWPFSQGINSQHSASPFDLAENGFYLKSSELASTIHNPLIELTDFTPETFSLQKSETNLKELFGPNNPCLAALPSSNMPLYKSLNYLAPQKFTSVSEVICSQNSGFVLIGGLNGSVSICSSQLHLTPIKTLQFFSPDVHKKRQKYLEVYQKLEARNTACIEYQQAICKKEQQLPFIADLAKQRSKSAPKKKLSKKASKKLSSPSAKNKIAKSLSKVKSIKKLETAVMKDSKKAHVKDEAKSLMEDFKNQVEKAALKKHSTTLKEKKQAKVEEPVVDTEVAKLKDEKIISINKEGVAAVESKTAGRQRTNSSSINVLGYTLLTKETASIDPLMVGCIYQSQSDETNGKFFLKLRRLMYQISYILNFINGCQLSGNLTNLVSGTQTMQRKMSKDQLEAILRHQDVMIDLVPIFVRTQVTKKQYPKWESKFPMMVLSETNEEELELHDVDRIIDFTNVAYSVASQNHIHLLCVQQDKPMLVQLRVDHFFGVGESFVGRIKLAEMKRIEVPTDVLRVFQVEDQVIVLCSNEYIVYKLEDLSQIRSVQLGVHQTPVLAAKAQICNETDKSKIYTARNLLNFKETGNIPEQEWALCLTDSQCAHRNFKLELGNKNEDVTSANKLPMKDVIHQAHAVDLGQIPMIVKAQKTGLRLVNYPRDSFKPSYSTLDTCQDLYTRLYFKKVTSTNGTSEFIVEVGKNVLSLSKQVHLQFSFKSFSSCPGTVPQQSQNQPMLAWTNYNQTVMRLPMAVEHVKGSQSGETVHASFLTSPDNQVFIANYPHPEFIFRHVESKKLILTQVTLWSKISKESQGGFPIGEGFIFFTNSVAELMDSAPLMKAIAGWMPETNGKNSLELLEHGLDALYFNLKDQDKMTIDLSSSKPCKFIKVIPTAFRSSPINYADCQDFTKDQAEMQFFGASGYIQESLLQELPIQDEEILLNPELNVQLEVDIFGDSREIASCSQFQVTKFLTSSQSCQTISAAKRLKDGIQKNDVGLASIQLAFMPDEICFKRFSIRVKEVQYQDWELSSLMIAVDAIQPSSLPFKSEGMRANVEAIAQTLLKDNPVNACEPSTQLEEFVQALISIIEGVDRFEDARRKEALLCLSKLAADDSLLSDTQRSNIILIVQRHLNVEVLFQYRNFIELSSTDLQNHFVNFIELFGLKRKPATRKATNILIVQVFQELSLTGKVQQVSTKTNQKSVVDSRHLLSIDMLKNVLNLVSRKRRPFVVSKFVDLINNELDQVVQNDAAYFKLRSELDINAFPFDVDYSTMDQFNPIELNHSGEEMAFETKTLPCDFQLIKINSSYMIKAQLRNQATVEGLRLHFRSTNSKGIHKFRVSILLHSEEDSPQLLFVKTYDESVFAQVTKLLPGQEETRKKKKDEEAMQQPSLEDYFDIQSIDKDICKVNRERLDPNQDLPFTYASPFSQEYAAHRFLENQIACQLDSQVNGSLFEVQVELLDSYRTINKATPFSQVMITPEFFGRPTSCKTEPHEESPKTLNQDLEEFSVGESLSLTVASLDVKNRQKSTKDVVITKPGKMFIPNKYLPSNFINRVAIGFAQYDVYSGLAADKTMKSVVNNFMFKHVTMESKCARNRDVKKDNNLEQTFSETAEELVNAQNQLREELMKDSTVKDSKSGMARIMTMCESIRQLKAELSSLRLKLPIDKTFFENELELKRQGQQTTSDQKVEKPGFREFGYQTFVSQTDSSVWFQLHQKGNGGILKYSFAMTELACIYLQYAYISEPGLIKEPAKLFKKLFKIFIAQEIHDGHPIVEEFLKTLYSGFEDEEKHRLLFDLVTDILIKPTAKYNFSNFLDYVQSDKVKFISVNTVLKQLNEMFVTVHLKLTNRVTNEKQAIDFLHEKIVVDGPRSRKTTSLVVNGNNEMSTSGMVVSALTFLVEHVSYRLRLCKEHEVQGKKRSQLHKDYPEMMEKISLANFSSFGATQIVNNQKFAAGQGHPKSTAFLLCFTEAFLKLTTLNMESLGQTIISTTLVLEDWLIILLAITQSGQAKIMENFAQATINLMLASKYVAQREIVQIFNYCLAFLLAQDVSLSQKVYRKAESAHRNGFSLLFSHYQSLVKIQTKVINVISARAENSTTKQPNMKKMATRRMQTLPTMTKELSQEFIKQIDIQKHKLGDFIKRLLSNLDSNTPGADSGKASGVLVEIFQSLAFLKDLQAKSQVTQAIVQQMDQLKDAQQIDFSKSVLATSEQLVGTPDKMKVNVGLLLSLIETIILQQLVDKRPHENIRFFQILCRNLLTLLLTGSNSRLLAKRTDAEKQTPMHRKETAVTYLETDHISVIIAILNKFIQARCKPTSPSTDTCTVLLDLSIANKLCELCLYSRHHNYISEELKPAGTEWALDAFDLTLTNDQAVTVMHLKQMLEFIVYNCLEDDEGIKPTQSSCLKPAAKMAQLCQKLGQIVIVIGSSQQNSLVCLPALMDLQSNLDREIEAQISEKKILDLRGFQLQQNANDVFRKMLVQWIGNAKGDNDISFKFLHELKGFDFIISRLSHVTPSMIADLEKESSNELTPVFLKRDMSQKTDQIIQEAASSEESSDDNDHAANMLKFVGNKLGLTLAKTHSFHLPKQLDLASRRDTELLNEAKVKIFMKKQAAIIKHKDESPVPGQKMTGKSVGFKSVKSGSKEQPSGKQAGKETNVKEQLVEKNYASQMKLVDCSEGDDIVAERQIVKWSFSALNAAAVALVVGQNEDRKQEYQMTFDLTELVQFSEIIVTLENPDKPNNAANPFGARNTVKVPSTAKPEYPYAIILEGKRSTPFHKNKKPKQGFWEATPQQINKPASSSVDSFVMQSQQETNLALTRKESQLFNAQNDNKLQEQINELVIGTVDYPDWNIQLQQNSSKPFEFLINNRTNRYEAQYVRFRFVFSDQVLCTTVSSTADGTAKLQPVVDKNAVKTHQRVINLLKFTVMGSNCLETKEILHELAQMNRKNAMNCLAEYFTKTPKNVLAKITKNSQLQRSFINSFDILEPFLLQNSGVILPIFIQMASMSEELCTELIQTKILLDYSLFTVKHQMLSGDQARQEEEGDNVQAQRDKELEVMLTLLDGLVMSKPDKQVSRLQSVLEYIIEQLSLHERKPDLQDRQLHINFVVGVANLFVECCSLIAKEMRFAQSKSESLEKPEATLTLTNADILKLLSLANSLQNQQTQKSINLLVIFLLQLPQPFKASGVDLTEFIKLKLLPRCDSVTVESIEYCELLSLLLCNQPSTVDPLLATSQMLHQITSAIVQKTFNDDQTIDLIRIVYNCISTGLMRVVNDDGMSNQEAIARAFYGLLRPFKSDGKVVIGAEKLKFNVAKAVAKTLLAIVNDELKTTPDSKAVEQIIKEIHEDVLMTQENVQEAPSLKKKKAVKKTEQSNLFVSLVFEPLLKLQLTVPVSITTLLPDLQGHVKIQQFYKQTKQQGLGQNLLPTDSITKDNVAMFIKALKQQSSAHSLNLSEEIYKNQWQKLIELECAGFPETTVHDLIGTIKDKNNLLFVLSTKVDSCQNTGVLPESDQFVMQLCFFCPSMLEQSPEKGDIPQYGQQCVLEPNPKECKGSFFFICAPEKIGSAVFIPRENNNLYMNDFQIQKYDNGDGLGGHRYCLYMMNQIVTTWEPKMLPTQNIWFNLNEHVYYNEDETFKKVIKAVQYKQGLLQKFSVFHFNPSKVEAKQEINRDIGVPRYQLVGQKAKEGKKKAKGDEQSSQFNHVDEFSSLSFLNQNLILQVPLECRLSTLQKMIDLPPDMRFVDPSGQPGTGLLGSAIESSKTIGDLQRSGRIVELFTQTPQREAKEDVQDNQTKRVFKAVKPDELKPDIVIEADTTQPASFTVFDKYLVLGGSEQMLDMAIRTVEQYRNKKMKDMFVNFLKDLKMFSILPGFSDLFFKPQDKKELLLQMIKKDYADINLPKKKASIEYQKAQKEISAKRTLLQGHTAQAYEVMENLFKKDSEELEVTVKQFINSGVLQNLLQSISTMSGEFSRRKSIQEELKTEQAKAAKPDGSEEESGSLSEESLDEPSPRKFKMKKVVEKDMINSEDSEWEDQELIKKAIYEAQSDIEDDGLGAKKTKKKKGVGYTTEIGEIWDVNAYLKLKETKNASLLRVFRIIQKFLEILGKIKDSTENYYERMRDSIIESAVLPTIESALRSGSLLEMAKEMELYQTYIHFIEKLASIPHLFDLILELPDDYEPKQRDSILSLLQKNRNLSEVFLACLDQNENTQKISKADTDEVKNPKQLATLFIEASTNLTQLAQQKAKMEQQKTIESILAMPIDKQYLTLLEDQRFNYYSFRPNKQANAQLEHYFGKEEKNAKNPPNKKLIRLAQEIADLTNSLPVEYTSAIFCRVDKKRVDYMKCLIMGATGTPYANGAFTFDIFFDNKYPEGPPKVQLTTTGGGQVRFNPNLYACGKVCLSLLGTWRGQSTENWDPKVSTTLQVLMSIQAIIMSNEVYFNEPGYEQEAGTVDGEKRNTGYSNIIRYATAKYAILDHLENPTKGFEQAIHRSFFVKKQFILDEIDGWIKEAEKQAASYQNLVLDHNYNLGQKFQKEGEYLSSLKQVRDDIKTAFEKLKLESSGAVSYNGNVYGIEAESETKVASVQEKSKGDEVTKDFQKALDQIDVSYDNPTGQQTGSINIDDEKVKDRWSRYIGAMGIEAVAKQAESTVFISGMGPLGVEIAKNIILAGCKELILHDKCSPIAEDLDGQFFLEEKDIGSTKTRAQLCQMKIQELNSFVKVTLLPSTADLLEFFKSETCRVKVAVFTDCMRQDFTADKLSEINESCRTRTQMIIADNSGLFSRVITDFGPQHTVLDSNGEPALESMVESIESKEGGEALITLLKGQVHGLQDGDTIELSEVKGMRKVDCIEEQIDTSANAKNSASSINGNHFKVLKVVTSDKFVINCNMENYTKFERDGVVKQIKMPSVLESQPLRKALSFNDGETLDFGFFLDFDKFYSFKAASICYRAWTKSVNYQDFMDLCEKHFDKDELDKAKTVAEVFWTTKDFYMPPICAFIGGVVAQEVIKGITQKFTPIKQEFYFDAIELFEKNEDKLSTGQRYKSLYACLGKSLFTKIQDTKLFMIGAGAIGCELLKNFAMLGLGSGQNGLITLTDPDVIEVSNLNRQFLFREKHLRKPKSMTAAAASIQMNPNLKGHIDARLDKVHADTVSTYSEAFFKSQQVVANALDNVQARLFIDAKCVNARVPLLDSGTLGPKGHVQVIIPFKTESYSSQRDPEENLAIPHCTLKMFPEETLHCVEWAKDIFGTLFTLNPQNFNKLKSTSIDEIEFHQSSEFKNIKQVIKIAQNRPKTFDDCIRLARVKFQKYFNDNILQLLHVYPLDKVLADGKLFWTLPKRPPTAQNFDADQTVLHRDFIAAYACLTAKVYGIKIPFEGPRSTEAKNEMARIASKFEVKPFVSNDQKANAIESQVEKQNQPKDGEAPDEQQQQAFDPHQLREQFEKHVSCEEMKTFAMSCEEFEKDDDSNFHIDFICACANIRALNYGLKEMDWLTVKLKAGRIVPALATTTSAIAGLQTIEILKLLKLDQLKLCHFKNTYLNLAVPSIMSSEPGAPAKNKIKDGLETDLWDRWAVDISKETTMADVLATLQDRYNLVCRDVIFESTPVFMYALRDRNLALLKQPVLMKTVISVLQQDGEEEKLKVLEQPGDTIDLTVTFVDPDAHSEDDSQEHILQNIPTVRLTLK